MRRRFFALGYVFFALLTVTGLIMAISFIARISSKPVRLQPDLISAPLSDSVAIQADPAFVVTNMGRDFQAALKNFHYYPAMPFIATGERSNCLSCHLPLPHNKNPKLRAFLNMHGNFVACQTCHAATRADSFQWLDVKHRQVVNVLPSGVPLMAVQLVPVREGQVGYTGAADADFQKLLTTTGSDLQRRDALCREQFRGQPDQVLNCQNCHTDREAVLDWQTLGYAPERIARLTSLSIPSVFQKYDNFYIPEF